MWTLGDSSATGNSAHTRQWRKGELHILVIDKEPEYVRLLQDAFTERNWRHHVHAVEDSRQATNYIFNFTPYSTTPKPHLVILHANSPGFDWDAFAKLDALLDERNIPVILVGCAKGDREAARSRFKTIKFFVIRPLDKDHVRRISRLVQFYSNLS